MIYFLIALLVLSVVANCFYYLHLARLKRVLNRTESENELNILKAEDFQSKVDRLIKECGTNEALSRLVDQSPNAIMLMDSNANILSVNKGFEAMYEYDFASFIRNLGDNYRQTSFSSEVQNRLDWVFENKLPFRYEALNVTRTGKEIWTQTALMPLLDNRGEISHLVTIDTDIHQRVIKSDGLVEEMETLNAKIDQLSQRYKGLKTESENLFSAISGLYALIEETKTILSFIKSVSDETRILGFNASIEASRAGEYGSGFRVITNQIVEISHNTIKSVSEISEIVDSITSKQDELMIRKDDSEDQIKEHEKGIAALKELVVNIEQSIAEFKSLS